MSCIDDRGLGHVVRGKRLHCLSFIGPAAILAWALPASAGKLRFSPGSLSFTAQVGASSPAAQTLQVSSSASGGSYTLSAATSSGGNWLTCGVSSPSTPATVTCNVYPSVVIAPGTYNGTITITASGLTGS